MKLQFWRFLHAGSICSDQNGTFLTKGTLQRVPPSAVEPSRVHGIRNVAKNDEITSLDGAVGAVAKALPLGSFKDLLGLKSLLRSNI